MLILKRQRFYEIFGLAQMTLACFGCLLWLSACQSNGSADDNPMPTPIHTPSLEDELYIQLMVDEDHPLHTHYAVDVVEVDLLDTSATTMAQLKRQGDTQVMCYFSAGSYESWRDDANQFPATILGNDYDGWAGEKWLDIRSDALKPILQARLDVAKSKGCDGVDPDNVNGFSVNTGFDLNAQDQLTFNRWLAAQAHARGLFIALKNDGEQAADLVDDFDAVVSEECYAYDECAVFAPFIEAGKPVWDIEYTNEQKNYSNPSVWQTFCQDTLTAKRHGYWMDDNLAGTFRQSCDGFVN